MRRRRVVEPLDRRGKVLVATHPHTLSGPEDALSAFDELAYAAHYPQSSLSQLASWGVVASVGRPSLSQRDGDPDFN